MIANSSPPDLAASFHPLPGRCPIPAFQIYLPLDNTSWRYSQVSSVESTNLASVGRSYLNRLLEFYVGAQITLRRKAMVGRSRTNVEIFGESFLRGYCGGVSVGCVERS